MRVGASLVEPSGPLALPPLAVMRDFWYDFGLDLYVHPETGVLILAEDMPWELLPEPLTRPH